jgi:hypothetical protein
LIITRFLQPTQNDNLVIITLPEPKKVDQIPKEVQLLPKKWSTSEQEYTNTDLLKDSNSPITPIFVKGSYKEEHYNGLDNLPKLQRQGISDKARNREEEDLEINEKMDSNAEIPSRKLSKSLRNFAPNMKDQEVSDHNFPNAPAGLQDMRHQGDLAQHEANFSCTQNWNQGNLLINVASMKVVQSQPGISSSRRSRGGGQGHSTHQLEDQKKKKDRMSIIEDMKLEVYGDELHIINNLNEEIDIPLDSLKVSTIHDISKNIQDKLQLDTLDQDEQFLLESKLGSFK